MPMPQKKLMSVLIACAFIVAALVARFTGLMPAHIRDFGLITSTLGRIQFLFAALPWVILSVYWEHAAKTAAPAKSSESGWPPPRPSPSGSAAAGRWPLRRSSAGPDRDTTGELYHGPGAIRDGGRDRGRPGTDLQQ